MTQAHAAPGTPGGARRRGRLAVVLAVVAVAASLRSPLTSVPPLVGDLDRALGLSSAGVGLLTALPVLCMGALAPLAAYLSARLGLDRAVAVGAALVALGTAVRPWGPTWLLYAGTLVVGAGIAVVGALLPGAIKQHFPRRPGAMTGVYMASMLSTATVAAACSVPVASAWGWRWALGLWAVPAVLGLVVWLPRAVGAPRPVRVGRVAGSGLPRRSRTAWWVTAYLTGSSVSFYTLLAWLAPSYVERGWSEADAGVLLGVFNAAQLVAALLVPLVVDRLADRRGAYVAAAGLTLVALVSLVAAPDAAPWATAALLGLGNGAMFTLGLTMLVEHAASAQDSARLSGLAFGVSYLVAAAGPAGVGWLHDATASYTVPFFLLLLVVAAQAAPASALRPGRRVGGGERLAAPR